MTRRHDTNDGTLSGDSFYLRMWKPEDAVWYVKSRDEEIFKWTTEIRDLTVEQAKTAIKEANSNPTMHCYAIVESSTRRLMGNIALVVTEKDSAEIMYWLAPEGRGRGLATKSVKLLSDWAFESLSIEEIVLKTHWGNILSQRVAERAGYVSQKGSNQTQSVWSYTTFNRTQ